MKTFFQRVDQTDPTTGVVVNTLGVRGFDPCSMVNAGRVQVAVTVGVSCEFYLWPTPAEARTLAAALLSAADTFEGGSGAYLVRYLPSPPVYPEKPIAHREVAFDLRDLPTMIEAAEFNALAGRVY